MTSIICIVAVLFLLILGILSCFVNKIPGPLFVFIALLLMRFVGGYNIPAAILILGAILVALSLLLSYKGIPRLKKFPLRLVITIFKLAIVLLGIYCLFFFTES